MEKNRSRFGLKMLVMPTIILLLVSFYPLFNSIYLSVTNTNILKKGQTVRFTGAANFIKLFPWSMRLSVWPPATCWDSFWPFC